MSRIIKELKGKIVVITGASGGAGRAAAKEYGRHGCKVVLLARGIEGLKGAQKEVEEQGGEAIYIQTELADAAQVEAAAERVEREWGPIDIWVNNAMNSVFAPIKDVKPEEYKHVTDVTYLGQVYGTLAVLKRMRERNRGSIVFVGSALAYRGIPLQSAYCGAKHAIEGFYDSLRCELMHEKSQIKTCMVQLPAMNTTQFGWVLSRLPNEPRPMGKVYAPEVAARAIVFASLHNRRSIWVGYPTWYAIIGNFLAPWYADWVLARTGFKGQQTDKPVSPGRRDNLWQPVPGDSGTYGNFDDISARHSFTLWLTMHRTWVYILLIVAAAWLLVGMM